MLLIIGVALASYLPYFIWAAYHKVGAFNFISYFLGTASKPDWASEGVKSFRKYDSSLKEFVFLFHKGNGLLISLSFLLPLFHFVRNRGKDIPHNYIFLLLFYLILIMILWHISNIRHTIMLLPLVTFLVGYTIHQIITKKVLVKAIIILLLLFAGHSAYYMPNYRQKYNAPKEFRDLAEIIKKDHSPNARTLCIYKFDILIYSRKHVIWPHPKQLKTPVDLLEKQNADELYRLLKKYQIKYILIDKGRVVKSDHFRSRTYPLYFVITCGQLHREGKLTVQALSYSKRFMLLKVV